MKTVLITGINGLIGSRVTRHILDKTDFTILGAASTQEKFDNMLTQEGITIPERERIRFIANDTLIASETNLGDIYAAVHLAFSRRNCPACNIASSIDFASAVFKKLANSNVTRVINISSQGVYGKNEEFRTELTSPAPETQYTMAKYAAEVIFKTHFELSDITDYTSIRLDPVVQSQNLVVALCKQAIDGKIQLRGGEQRFSFIDVEDTASAIVAMLSSKPSWEHIYNVGWNRMRFTLTEVAQHVADVSERLGFGRPEISLDKQDIVLWAGLDTSRFTAHTGWTPEIDFDSMIEKIFKNL